jgi:hypothetical protein
MADTSRSETRSLSDAPPGADVARTVNGRVVQERAMGDHGRVTTDDTSPQPDERPQEELDAFDLDHDGEISLVESERARLGIIDARLEEIADEGGLKGKLAEGAHHLLDKLDND